MTTRPKIMITIDLSPSPRRFRRMLPIAGIALLLLVAVEIAGHGEARAVDAVNDAVIDAADDMADDEAAPISQLGGATRAIAVAPGGRTLWIGYGPRLAKVDLSDGVAPRLVAVSALLPEVVEAVAVDGDSVLVAAGAVLYRFAVRDFAAAGAAALPNAAVTVGDGARGEEAAAIVARPGTAYVLAGRRHRPSYGPVRLNPSRIAVVAAAPDAALSIAQADILPPGTSASDIEWADEHLFVASSPDPSLRVRDRAGRLLMFDVRSPRAPRLVGALDGRAWSDKLASPAAAGGAPDIVGLGGDLTTVRLDAEGRLWQRDFAADVGGRGFMGARGSSLVATAAGRVFAVYNGGYAVGGISSPTPAGEWLGFEGIPSGGAAAFGERLFASERGGRLHVVDVADTGDGGEEGDVVAGGELTATGRLDLVGEVSGVGVDGGRPGQVVVAVNQGGVASIAVGEEAGWRIADYAFDGHYRRDVDVADGVAVVIDGGHADRFGSTPELFTIGASGHVSQTAAIDHFWFGADYARIGNALFAADTVAEDSLNSAIAVWDIADPAAPRLVQRLPVDGEVKGLAEGAGRLVVPWIYSPEVPVDPEDPYDELRLDLFDISAPLAPSLLGTINPALRRVAWGPSAIELSGHHALLDWERETSPDTSERLLTAVDLAATAPGIPHGNHWPEAISGELIGAADGFAFVRPPCRYLDAVDPVLLRALDITDPTTPRAAWQATLPGTCIDVRYLDLAVNAGTLYVAAGDAGLYAYRPPLAWRPEGTPPSATVTPATSQPPAPPVTAVPWPTPGGSPTPFGMIAPLPTPLVPWKAYVPIASRR